jgi:hypothetical protein
VISLATTTKLKTTGNIACLPCFSPILQRMLPQERLKLSCDLLQHFMKLH